MVISACRIFSFMRTYSNTWYDDSDLETQMVEKLRKKKRISSIIPCDSIVVANNNNNYILDQDKSIDSNSNLTQLSRWSSSCNWTWNSSSSSNSNSRISSNCSKSSKILLLTTILSVMLILVIVGLVYLDLKHIKFLNNSNNTIEFTSSTMQTNMSVSSENKSQHELIPVPKSTNEVIDLKKVSRLTWEMINRNGDKLKSPGISGNYESQEIVLPASMVKKSYTSTKATGLNTNNSENSKYKERCCKTRKQSQIISEEGCEPKTIVNRVCEGKCKSVWIPGYFSSFPACKPSRTVWKIVNLTCGENRDIFKKIKVEKIKRCSCMEPEP